MSDGKEPQKSIQKAQVATKRAKKQTRLKQALRDNLKRRKGSIGKEITREESPTC